MFSISVFTLIRTDTTLDLSQKAEKVCLSKSVASIYIPTNNKFKVWRTTHSKHIVIVYLFVKNLHNEAYLPGWCTALIIQGAVIRGSRPSHSGAVILEDAS